MTFHQNERFLKEYRFCTLLMTIITAVTSASMQTILWPALVSSVVTALRPYLADGAYDYHRRQGSPVLHKNGNPLGASLGGDRRGPQNLPPQ